jgi:hypothetical protein
MLCVHACSASHIDAHRAQGTFCIHRHSAQDTSCVLDAHLRGFDTHAHAGVVIEKLYLFTVEL